MKGQTDKRMVGMKHSTTFLLNIIHDTSQNVIRPWCKEVYSGDERLVWLSKAVSWLILKLQTDFPKHLWDNQGGSTYTPFQMEATWLLPELLCYGSGSGKQQLPFCYCYSQSHTLWNLPGLLSLMSEECFSPLLLREGHWCLGAEVYPLITAIGLSLMAFLLIPASWQVFTTSVTFL